MKRLLLAVVCAGLSLPAMAEDAGGLFVEPGISYQIGDAQADFPGVSTDGDLAGFGILGRVGFHISESFFAALDGRFQKLTFEDQNSIFNYDSSGDAFNWGPIVGVQMPDVGLRVWAGYIVDSQFNPDADGALDVKFDDGTGYRVGVGFRLAAVSLNLEYQDLKYDRTVVQQLGPFAPGTVFDGVELKNKSWIASVSFPLEL